MPNFFFPPPVVEPEPVMVEFEAIAKKAHKEGLTLKASALALGYLTEDEYTRWIVPIDMTHPSA